MESPLHVFVRQMAWAVAAALAPVVLVSFLTIPYSLGGHPGEVRTSDLGSVGHMT